MSMDLSEFSFFFNFLYSAYSLPPQNLGLAVTNFRRWLSFFEEDFPRR